MKDSIFFKVNNGEYKMYLTATPAEIHDALNDLVSRALAKGYKKIGVTFGSCGKINVYSNGVNVVELVYVSNPNEIRWLKYANQQQKDSKKAA